MYHERIVNASFPTDHNGNANAMLTRKQHETLAFITDRIDGTGMPPSFDEIREHLGLASKSGVHRLVEALEERGFIRRLPNRARAIEVVKRVPSAPKETSLAKPTPVPANDRGSIPMMGKIAAGVPIAALQIDNGMVQVPPDMLGAGEHFALKVTGDSMIEAGILDGDTVVIARTSTARPGEIVVALIDNEEATLKRYRRKGDFVALEAANPAYETRFLDESRVSVQGKLIGVMRSYH